jgi:hypothetical protein
MSDCACGPEATCMFHQEPGAYHLLRGLCDKLDAEVTELRSRLSVVERQLEVARGALEAINTGMCTGIGSPPSCGCRTCIARRALASLPSSPAPPTKRYVIPGGTVLPTGVQVTERDGWLDVRATNGERISFPPDTWRVHWSPASPALAATMGAAEMAEWLAGQQLASQRRVEAAASPPPVSVGEPTCDESGKVHIVQTLAGRPYDRECPGCERCRPAPACEPTKEGT